jgi:predicted nucleic acid binding AN1-type Zn finger protein
MARYEIDVPAGVPADVEVTCTDHGVTESCDRSRRTLPFYCPDCETEVEVTLHDAADWRDLAEMC